jgi:hydrogenase expression/formation protein HypE
MGSNKAADKGLVRLEHGSGGALSRELVERVIYPRFRGASYEELSDAAPFRLAGPGRITTDSYVVDPPFFPGGNIGRLAVIGTCNDLAVSGAAPVCLTLGLVIEEGFAIGSLEAALEGAAAAAAEAGVPIVTGDTKVVPAGKGGGLFINTTGVGELRFAPGVSALRIEPGDRVLVSAPVGAHGIAVLAAREKLSIGADLRSDCALLYPLCSALFGLGEDVRFLRDATRGGLAAVLNETARDSGLAFEVIEAEVPVDPGVASVADLLGLDPLEVANEGVLVAVVAARSAGRALAAVRDHPLGRRAALVGEVGAERSGRVTLATRVGGRRILDFPRGILLPRIC